MTDLNQAQVELCAKLLSDADAIVIGSGAGLTAAAGINYTDKQKFREVFPAWAQRGFSMQYELMGYNGWSETEKWGYYTTHLNYVYFSQKELPLYQQLRNIVADKPYFIFTSNVDELFHKNNFDPEYIYSPQGSYGRIQCEKPCRPDSLWDAAPFQQRMQQALDQETQVLIDPEAVPVCPNCGGSMFVNARIDGSFIETPYESERERFTEWLQSRIKDKAKVLLLELGAGFNTPGVIRMPMEAFAQQLPDAALVRVNLDHASIPESLLDSGLSIAGDIAEFIETLERITISNPR